MDQQLNQWALQYHKAGRPGKLAICATKPLATQTDLALAYSPGVAAACQAIVDDPLVAADVTARGQLVAVISNGTAVLGMGNIGPLASKPVMEGKAVLFKKFADLDAFDLEIDERDLDALVETIARLEPTFGGINLEDFKAPECFELERRLQKRMGIPVFHDDQHGTAIVVSAALLNALTLTGKSLESLRLVTSGAGAAALACLDLLVTLGMRRENIIITDLDGVVYHGRPGLTDPEKMRYASHTPHRTLAQAMVGCDVFLGLSVGNVVTKDMVAQMAPRPLVFALANPVPEILPTEVQAIRPDAIYATGRSDFKNQINNLLCFPFIFRGALDVGARVINTDMKLACVRALADLAHQGAVAELMEAYPGETFAFGPEYIIPKPFDPRLLSTLSPAVARAAMDSGVATRPIADLAHYAESLRARCRPSGRLLEHVLRVGGQAGHTSDGRGGTIVYPQGDDLTIVQAAQSVARTAASVAVQVCGSEGVSSWEVRRAELMKVQPSSGDHPLAVVVTATSQAHNPALWHKALWGATSDPFDQSYVTLYCAGDQAWAITVFPEAHGGDDSFGETLSVRAVEVLRSLHLCPVWSLPSAAHQDGASQRLRKLSERFPEAVIEANQVGLPAVSMIFSESPSAAQAIEKMMSSLQGSHCVGRLGLSKTGLLGVCAPKFDDIVDLSSLLSVRINPSL